MKKIEAIISPFQLDEVKEALAREGVQRVTLSEVRGFEQQGGHTELYRGSAYVIDFRPKIKVELLVGDDEVAAYAELIEKAGHLEQSGDSRILLSSVDDIIRTGEPGYAAVATGSDAEAAGQTVESGSWLSRSANWGRSLAHRAVTDPGDPLRIVFGGVVCVGVAALLTSAFSSC